MTSDADTVALLERALDQTAAIIAAISASEAGLAVILCNSDDQLPKEARYLDLLEEHRVQGILITPVGGAEERLVQLQQRGTPVILVDGRSRSGNQCSVAVDDVFGGDVALSHLLQAGHERLAFASGPLSLRQVADRRDGDAVIDLGLQKDKLGLGEPRLGIEHEEVCLRTQLELALLRSQSLLCQIERR